MSKINLLPWRAERRALRQRRFLLSLALVVVMAAAAVYAVYAYYQSAIDFQRQRNAFLQSSIKALDIKIAEIKELDAIKESVINRIQVIERLQQQRPQIVNLFDEWLDTLPEGVYLTEIEQRADGPTQIKGQAQSNGRVSDYMSQLAASVWLSQPRLIIIKTADSPNGTRTSEFALTVKEENPLLDKLKKEQEDAEAGS